MVDPVDVLCGAGDDDLEHLILSILDVHEGVSLPILL
jgi:hypothetical protein